MRDNIKIGNNALNAESSYIGQDVVIGHNCILEDNVFIGDGTYIDSNSIIRSGTRIGKHSFIGSNCILGEYQMDFVMDRQVHGHQVNISYNPKF